MAESKGTLRAEVGARAPRRVSVDGVELAYDDAGSGPPIVCLHAIGHGARDFERLATRFGQRYRVVALDWPGQGRSGGDPQPPTAARYAELLAGFLAAARIERPVLLGNSIGGAASIRYAAQHPEDVRALVLENPGGLAPIDDAVARNALALMVRFFAAGARGARWFPLGFAAYYRSSVLKRPAAAEQRRRITASAKEIAPLLHQAWSGFSRPESDLRALAPLVTCPVLFAWARGDQFVQLKRSLAGIRLFPNARLETFKAGHAAHLEAPDEFEAALERFLDQLPAATLARSVA